MKKLFGNKKLLIVAVVTLLVLGATVMNMFMPGVLPALPISVQMGSGGREAAPAAEAQPEARSLEVDSRALQAALAEKTFVSGQGVMYEAGARVINLADPSTRRYLRVALYLEFIPKDPNFYFLRGEERTKVQEEFIAKEVSPLSPVIEDTITSILTGKTAGDIFTMGGKAKLKQEIKDTLNSLILGLRVANVYFTEFLIQ